MGIFDRFRRRSANTARIEPVLDKQRRDHHGALKSLRMMDAAKLDRLTGDWGAQPITADSIISMHQRIIVARSREQVANNDYAKSFVRMCRQNIVGPRGVQLQAQSRDASGGLDTAANQAIEAAFDKWSRRKNCDITGQQSWPALQAAAVTSAAINGEFMFRMIFGKDAGPFGIALQALDPQRCNPQFDVDKLPNGRYIRAGIEFDQYARSLAYYFSTNSDSYYNFSHSGKNYQRIPADEIIHGFEHEMIGQRRGLPWMATSLLRMRHLNGFETAAVVNARIGASKLGFIQWKEGRGPEFSEDEQLNLEMRAEPGEWQVLPDGAETSEWNPQYPNGEFAIFNKAMLRGMASGWGVAYNNLANDLEGVNFSSIRQGALDEREHWKGRQEWLIEQLIQPVFDAWLPRALLGGHITIKSRPLRPERIDRYSVVSWQARRWAWIDPRADVEAAISAKNHLLQSPGQIIREGGRDPSDVWREIASDIAEMRAAGIPEEYIKASILDKNLQASVYAEENDSTPES